MRLLIATDSFPPDCGGSGWSTFHLCRALRDAGHELEIVKPDPAVAGLRRRTVDGLAVVDFGFRHLDVPLVRAATRAGMIGRLAVHLAARVRDGRFALVHGQHWTSGLAAVRAAAAADVPSVVTVRDYWPTCYFTTWHVAGQKCPDCSVAKMAACMRAKAPHAYWAALPLVPWMRTSVRARQDALRRASAVIAVSRFVAEEVVRPIAGEERTRVVPNPIDRAAVESALAGPAPEGLPERFLLFAGKLTAEKGARLAVDAAALSRRLPLVVVGAGPERAPLERQARDRGADVRWYPWLDNAELLRVMARATVLLAPSLWPEPLSRTVLEAMAIGVPVVATDVGGIRDQIDDGRSGRIVRAEARALADAADALAADEHERRRLADAARAEVVRRFDRAVVVRQMESLYRAL